MKYNRTFVCLLILLLISTALSFADSPKYSQKNIKKFSHPQASSIEGCIAASCLKIKDDLKVCKCLKNKDAAEGSLVLYEGQNIKLQMPILFNFGRDTKTFEALECDMEGNGKKQIVIANFNDQSVGMGITYWSIYIVDLQSFNRPLMFDVEDYGEGSIYWNEKERRCHALATSWEWVKDFRLGNGLYFIGKIFRYKSGVLEPTDKSSILARRYLFSFENERLDTLSKREGMKGAPSEWLANPKTEKFKLDPVFENFDGSSSEQGIINEVNIAPDGILTIVAQLSTKQIVHYVYPELRDSDSKNIIDAFGECGYQMSYPHGYVPSDPIQWLTGKEVTIKSFYDATRKENHHLFLLKCCQ